MGDTRDKLLEAKYFLEQMKLNESNREAFRYNLSAFLSAARSVTFIMQNEFSQVSGFKEWYNEKGANMKTDSSMKFLNDKRVMSIHLEQIRPHAKATVSLTARIKTNVSISALIKRTNGTVERLEPVAETNAPPSTETPPPTARWRWYFDEIPDKDVVTLGLEYIGKLEALVAEWESR